MAKVMTNQGGVLSTETIADKPRKPPGAAAPLEMKAGDGAAPPVVDAPEMKADAPKDQPKEAPEAKLDPEDEDLPERARRRIGKYSVAAKQEAALRQAAEAEAEQDRRLAENLFNEREMYRAKVADLEARIPKEQAAAPAEIKAPDPEDAKYKSADGQFDWRRFSDDNATYHADKAIEKDRASREAAAQKQLQEAKNAEMRKRVVAANEKYKDWNKVVTESAVVLPNAALQYIQESEYGTDIAYFLALPKNQAIAERIKALPPIRAIAELGKIETGFEKPAESVSSQDAATSSKTVERQGAPAPITPIPPSGTGSINVDPSKMSFQELRAYERERSKNRRR